MNQDGFRDGLAAGLGGTEGGRRPTGVPPSPAAAGDTGSPAAAAQAQPASSPPAAQPDAEVLEKSVRRRFTAPYKLRILEQADACRQSGQLGALLRREGLYASLLASWRRQRDAGALAALKPKRRGRKPQPVHPLVADNERLRRENERLAARLRQAEIIIDVQKKVSEILQATPSPSERNT